MKRYRHRATIQTESAFPVDMLRYDACYPSTERDSTVIQNSITDHDGVTVTVERIDTEAGGRWTLGRWRSFCCEIVKTSNERLFN